MNELNKERYKKNQKFRNKILAFQLITQVNLKKKCTQLRIMNKHNTYYTI